MQGMIRCVLVAGLLYGCHTDDTDTPDAPVGTGGLEVRWTSRPGVWPGTLASDLTIDDARFRVDSLRAIGDAGPGDPRTTSTIFEVHWDNNDAPGVITFADAPVGLYSQLALVLDGNDFGSDNAYELRGHVTVASTDYEWRIDDAVPLPINLTIDKMLKPSEASTIDIDVDFVHALDSIDWTLIIPDSGRLEVDEGDAVITDIRMKLVESFKTSSPPAGAQ